MYWNCAVAGVNCKSWLFDIVALLPIAIPLLELTSNEVEPWSITIYIDIQKAESGVTNGQRVLNNDTYS